MSLDRGFGLHSIALESGVWGLIRPPMPSGLEPQPQLPMSGLPFLAVQKKRPAAQPTSSSSARSGGSAAKAKKASNVSHVQTGDCLLQHAAQAKSAVIFVHASYKMWNSVLYVVSGRDELSGCSTSAPQGRRITMGGDTVSYA